MKQITYNRAADKALSKMPRKTAQRIMAKVSAYAADPASHANNVKALVGSEAIRLRVGDYRVVMVDGEVLNVIKIGPRGSVY